MKTLYITVLKFFFVAILYYLIFLIIWEVSMPNYLKKNLHFIEGNFGFLQTRIKEAKQAKEVDILFLGSSHTYRGFDPRIFKRYNYRSFNLGSMSQTPIQTKVLLSRYLDSIRPKLIIYEVYPIIFMNDGVEAGLDLISNDVIDVTLLKMAFALNHIKIYNSLIISMLSEYIRVNKSENELLVKGEDHYVSGGYVQKSLKYYKKSKLDTVEISFNPKQIEEFNWIIQYIKSKNMKLLLVFAPIPKSTLRTFKNIEKFNIMMANKAEYINFNTSSKLIDTIHFYDSNHLNQLGVEIFNKELIDHIKMKYQTVFMD